MSGRADYEERKQMRKEKYQDKIIKAQAESNEYNKNYQKLRDAIPLGQPILTDHYSANATRNAYKRMNTQFDKSVEADKKVEYYEDKINAIDNNNSIYSDDPRAIEKLQNKLERLEEQRKQIKAREHETYELTNIGAEIRRVKQRIENIKELEQLKFEDIEFKGGKVIHNREQNRIQFIFESIPNEDIRTELKHRGFKWARTQGAWQRLFNKNGIYEANRVLEKLDKEAINNDI